MTVREKEQLNLFLMAFDDARAKLLSAIKTTSPKPAERETNATLDPPLAMQSPGCDCPTPHLREDFAAEDAACGELSLAIK